MCDDLTKYEFCISDSSFLLSFPNVEEYQNHFSDLLNWSENTKIEFFKNHPLNKRSIHFTSIKKSSHLIDVRQLENHDDDLYDVMAKFDIDILQCHQLNIKFATKLQIIIPQIDNILIGSVFKPPSFDSTTCLVQIESKDKISGLYEECDISIVINSFDFQQQTKSLIAFAQNHSKKDQKTDYDKFLISHFFVDVILGQIIVPNSNQDSMNKKIFTSNDILHEDLDELNECQKNALLGSLNDPLHLIQGPPGTGKTRTTISIIRHLLKLNNNNNENRILICTTSNSAIDHICYKLDQESILNVRISSKKRLLEKDPNTDHLIIDNIMKSLLLFIFRMNNNDDLKNLNPMKQLDSSIHKLLFTQDLKKSYENYLNCNSKLFLAFLHVLIKKNKKELKRMKMRIKKAILGRSRVVCSTISMVNSSLMRDQTFHTIIIEESAKSHEMETLACLLKDCQKICMIGDHKQLGPMISGINANELKETNLGHSMFERLINLGNSNTKLNLQYRMHPFLSRFPSHEFYNNELADGINESKRSNGPICKFFKYFDMKQPFMFVENYYEEEVSQISSYYNLGEIEICFNIIKKLLEFDVKQEHCTILTFYESQKIEMLKKLKSPMISNSYGNSKITTVDDNKKNDSNSNNQSFYKDNLNIEGISVSSVDSFQGLENELIIVLTSRSNNSNKIGFLKDLTRINVALTRAKCGLIIIGNSQTLGSNDVWKNLIDHCRSHDLVFDPKVNDLISTFKNLNI